MCKSYCTNQSESFGVFLVSFLASFSNVEQICLSESNREVQHFSAVEAQVLVHKVHVSRQIILLPFLEQQLFLNFITLIFEKRQRFRAICQTAFYNWGRPNFWGVLKSTNWEFLENLAKKRNFHEDVKISIFKVFRFSSLHKTSATVD